MQPVTLPRRLHHKDFDGAIVIGGRRNWRKEFRHQDSAAKITTGRNARVSIVRENRGSLDGLQFFAWLEAHGLPWRNGNLCAGTRVSPDTGLPRPDIEHAEPAQFNPIALGERTLHAAENGFYGQFGFGFSDSGLVDHFVDDVKLDHGR